MVLIIPVTHSQILGQTDLYLTELLSGDIMKKMKLRRVNRPAYAVVSIAAALLASTLPANAQVDEDAVEEIIVTGSRIPRTGFETLQPATVLDSEKLDLRGNVDIAT